MAQPALDPFIRRGFLVKAEVTEGTDSVPVAGTDGVVVLNGSIATRVDQISRQLDRPYFGGYPFVVANKRVEMGGTFELYAPATPGQVATSDAACAKFLLPCGMAVTKDAVAKTTRYNPISSGIPSCTMYGYHSGTLVKSLGTRGDIKTLLMKIGDRFSAQHTMTGTYATYDGVALPSITLPTKVPVVARYSNSECKISASDGTSHGTATAVGALAALHVYAKSFQIDFGNTVVHKEYTEFASNGITDRQPKFTLVLAKTDITNDFNPWFVRDAGTMLDITFQQWEEDTKGHLYSLLGGRCQIQDIAETNTDGDYTWTLTGICVPSSAGGDEFYITFGDDSP